MLSDLRRRPRLATRLTIATLALLLPIYLILLAGYAAGVQAQRTAQVGDSVVFGQMAATVVEGFRRDLEGTLLAASLALGDTSRPLDQASVGPYLDALSKSYPTLRALFLTDPQGRVIASQASTGVGADVAGRPYIVALQAGADAVWSGGLAGLQTGQTTIAYARTVRGTDGRARGFLVAAFQPLVVVERLPVSLANDARLVLVDERGRVLFASDATELGDLDA
jgi:hypothetical protein